MQAELKGDQKNSGNRSQIRSLQRDQGQEPAKDGGCGIHSFPFPCGPSMRTPQALAISDRQQRIATRMRESHASMPLDEIGWGGR